MTPIQPNGTDAKDIALHFVKVTTGRATPTIIAKTINQAKSLLSNGYTKDEIIRVIDYIIKKGTEMYSLGYVSASINSVLNELRKEDVHTKAVEEKKKIEEAPVREVSTDAESTDRNKNKLSRFGIKQKDYSNLFDQE